MLSAVHMRQGDKREIQFPPNLPSTVCAHALPAKDEASAKADATKKRT